ncbi:helix-turn-helix domain-containing protein [Aneurinibacillus sp. Ricciae_BoGa-3]|uniref:helix-turn-helix domain-containing protein n=1 Tax=Aneurinibacillus sp. Ricciae_BoGa-3 TaxID=3022697 RepID=UPI00233F895D|nr:helix-turn-helix domain-containing protein [Aneurinibacillus sp. Ricciae_BoGa-3]WCK55068.1 helix-turn-helix domain-containing protein [Aneurinibacillus sp. Ricciae_BoGa-3]
MGRKKRSKQEDKQTFGLIVQLYPTKEQEVLIRKSFGCRRFLYNLFLTHRSKAWPPMRSMEIFASMVIFLRFSCPSSVGLHARGLPAACVVFLKREP